MSGKRRPAFIPSATRWPRLTNTGSFALGLSKVRTVFSSRILADGDRLIYRVRGNGFLKHMVRNMAGLLLEAGKGNVDEARIRRFLEAGGEKAGPTAPARGLFLVSVEYPPEAAG